MSQMSNGKEILKTVLELVKEGECGSQFLGFGKSGIVIIQINRVGKEFRANFPMPIIYICMRKLIIKKVNYLSRNTNLLQNSWDQNIR